MRSSLKSFLLSVLVTATSLAFFLPATASAFGITPPTFSITAARGSSFSVEVSLQKDVSTLAADIPISVLVSGELKDVITIAQPRFIIPAGQLWGKYTLHGHVNENLPNGQHRVRVVFRLEDPSEADLLRAGGSTGAAASLHLQLPIIVNLDVSGEQIVSSDFLSAQIDNTEVGLPFLLQAQFHNTGTVAWRPDQINVRLSSVDNASTTYEFQIPVKEFIDPSATLTYQLEQVHALPAGRYSGTATVVEQGTSTKQQAIPIFDVFTPGTLSKKLQLQYVSTDRSTYLVNDEAVIEVMMENIGAVRTSATVTVDLYLEGNRVDSQTSEAQTVEKADTGLVRFRFKDLKHGRYTAKAYADYGAKTTSIVEKDFSVVERSQAVALPGAATSLFSNLLSDWPTLTRNFVHVLRTDVTVQAANNLVVTPAVLVASTAAAVTGVGLLGLSTYIWFLFTQPFALLERRKSKAYGTVFNRGTRMPIDLAIVRLNDPVSGRPIASRVTDRFGRYLFLVKPGQYAMEARKPGVFFPPSVRPGSQEGPFADVYRGGPFATPEGVVAKNMPMDTEGAESAPESLRRKLSGSRLRWTLVSLGPIVAFFEYVVTPKMEQGIFLFFHLLLLGLFVRLARRRRPKSYGVVRGPDGKPLQHAVVRVVEADYDKVLDSQLTDARGRYAFLVGQNRYYLRFEKPGYPSATTGVIDYSKNTEPTLIDIDFTFKPAPTPAPTPVPAPTPAPTLVPAPTPVLACDACAHVSFDLYIINPDGSERHTGTPWVKTTDLGNSVTRYGFEDATLDPTNSHFDHNDVVIDVDSYDCAAVKVSFKSFDAAWKHKIRIKILVDGVEKSDTLLTTDDDMVIGTTMTLNAKQYTAGICAPAPTPLPPVEQKPPQDVASSQPPTAT